MALFILKLKSTKSFSGTEIEIDWNLVETKIISFLLTERNVSNFCSENISIKSYMCISKNQEGYAGWKFLFCEKSKNWWGTWSEKLDDFNGNFQEYAI